MGGTLEPRPTSWKITPLSAAPTGQYTPPGDSSITNLALTLGAMAVGATNLRNAVESPETVATRRILALLGVSFTTTDDGWLTLSKPDQSLSAPQVELDCAGYSETFALMLGLLVGQKFSSQLVGDVSLVPVFESVQGTLEKMGARLNASSSDGRLLVRIKGNPLYPVEAKLRQGAELFKQTVMLAGMAAVGVSKFEDTALSCDHTERILKTMGVVFKRQGTSLGLEGGQRVYSRWMKVPGDISAAAPYIALVAMLPGSKVVFKGTGINPGRTGILKIISRAGVKVNRDKTWQYGSEPVADIIVSSKGNLQPFNTAPNLLPTLARELPLLALIATQCEGTSSIKGLDVIGGGIGAKANIAAQVLRSFGADVEVGKAGLAIHGPTKLAGAEIQCAGDRSIASMAAVAALAADGVSSIHGTGYEDGELPGWMPDGCCEMLTSI